MRLSEPEVKVCGITRLVDGENAIALGVSFLGFILFGDSPRCIDPKEARKIWKLLNSDKTFSVAVDVDPDPLFLSEIVHIGFDFVQLHFPCTIDLDRVIAWSEIVGKEKLWLAPRVPPGDIFPEQFIPYADTFLVDSYSVNKFGGTGKVSDWKEFTKLKDKHPSKKWVLAGGLCPENLSAALSATRASLVDLNSGIESEPGIKDFFKMEKAFSILHDHN